MLSPDGIYNIIISLNGTTPRAPLAVLKKMFTHHVTGGYLERSYPEGEADQTSLGGRHWHLKFDEIGGGGGIGGGSGFL